MPLQFRRGGEEERKRDLNIENKVNEASILAFRPNYQEWETIVHLDGPFCNTTKEKGSGCRTAFGSHNNRIGFYFKRLIVDVAHFIIIFIERVHIFYFNVLGIDGFNKLLIIPLRVLFHYFRKVFEAFAGIMITGRYRKNVLHHHLHIGEVIVGNTKRRIQGQT